MPGDGSGIKGITYDGQLQSIELGRDADVYVFQRPTNVHLAKLIEHLVENGRTVVIDMDDDLSSIHPGNVAFKLLHPRNSPGNNWQHAQAACRSATLVTVSTEGLQERYGAGNSRVLKNCVPRSFLDLERTEHAEPLWGWPGAVHSHPDDLPIIAGAVQHQTLRDSFLIIGYPDGTGQALGLPEDARATGRVEFSHWSEALLHLDVGVAPLAESRFNLAKSWLKPLELSAVGCPWVASDIGEYRVLHALQPEAGVLVDRRTRSWVRALNRLLTDERARQEAGEAARALASTLTIEEHAWRWIETWSAAYEITQHRSRLKGQTKLEPVPSRISS
jgi:glycosyltransferase involved in cell wall biosynthesis